MFSVFCIKMGMEISKRRIDGRSTVHTTSILRILRVFFELGVLAVPTDDILPVLEIRAVQNPKILASAEGIHNRASDPEMLRVRK